MHWQVILEHYYLQEGPGEHASGRLEQLSSSALGLHIIRGKVQVSNNDIYIIEVISHLS